MQVNLNCDCNCPKPQFGMAFRRPEGKDLSKLSDYLGLSEEINRKGFAQYIKELKNHTRYDVVYKSATNSMSVIDNKTEQVVSSFCGTPNITGYSHFGAVSYPGKKFITKMLDPKQFLPYNLLLAGEKAQELETAAIAKEAGVKVMNEII